MKERETKGQRNVNAEMRGSMNSAGIGLDPGYLPVRIGCSKSPGEKQNAMLIGSCSSLLQLCTE